MTEDKLVGWPHQLEGHEFEQALGDSEGQGSLACCSPWGHKESDTTQELNNNNNTSKSNPETQKNQEPVYIIALYFMSQLSPFTSAQVS